MHCLLMQNLFALLIYNSNDLESCMSEEHQSVRNELEIAE